MLKVASLINIFSPVRPRQAMVKASFADGKNASAWPVYALIALNGFLLLSYLLGVNARASVGYEIKQQQLKVQKLTDEQKTLNLKFSQATAISTLSQDFAQNGFVPAGSPKFIYLPGGSQTAMK